MGGSGGGSLGGFSSGLPRPGSKGGGAPAGGGDACAFRFEIGLESVDPAVVGTIGVGTVCTVILVPQNGYDTVMVVDPGGRIVGTLSGFRGLATLIECIRGGNVYSATVTAKTSNTCQVLVERTATP